MDLQTLIVTLVPALFLVLFGGSAYAAIWLAAVFFSHAALDDLWFVLLLILPFFGTQKLLALFQVKGSK